MPFSVQNFHTTEQYRAIVRYATTRASREWRKTILQLQNVRLVCGTCIGMNNNIKNIYILYAANRKKNEKCYKPLRPIFLKIGKKECSFEMSSVAYVRRWWRCDSAWAHSHTMCTLYTVSPIQNADITLNKHRVIGCGQSFTCSTPRAAHSALALEPHTNIYTYNRRGIDLAFEKRMHHGNISSNVCMKTIATCPHTHAVTPPWTNCCTAHCGCHRNGKRGN